MLWFLNYFCLKFWRKNLRFYFKQSEKLIITCFFRNKNQFFAENRRKSPKISENCPKIAQKLPNMAENCRKLQKLQKIAEYCRKSPKIADHNIDTFQPSWGNMYSPIPTFLFWAKCFDSGRWSSNPKKWPKAMLIGYLHFYLGTYSFVWSVWPISQDC
jgi:hypothetical protein